MKLKTVKTITRIVVGFGATSITSQIVRNNVVPGSLFQKITITAAMIAAGGLLGETLGTYTDDKIDEIVEIVEDAQQGASQPV
jgi:hypothetical protein